MNFKWLHQSGFSIVQAMIISGVIAGSSLVVTRIMTDQKLSQKSSESRDQVEDLHNLIYTVLQNKAHCTSTMLTNGVTAQLGAAGGSPTLNTIVTSSPSRVVVNTHNNSPLNVYMNGNVIVKEMEMDFSAPNTGKARLRVKYERLSSQESTKRTKSGYGSKEIHKLINLRIQRNPNFVSCYALTDSMTNSSETGNDISKEFCESFEIFSWSEELSTCTLSNTQCPAGEIYTGIDSVGEVKCRKLDEWFNFEEVIDPTAPASCPVGYRVGFEIYNAGGGTRVRIRCVPP